MCVIVGSQLVKLSVIHMNELLLMNDPLSIVQCDSTVHTLYTT